MIYGYARVSTKGQAKDGNSLEARKQVLIGDIDEFVWLLPKKSAKISRFCRRGKE